MIKSLMKEIGLYFRVLAAAATAPWNGEISPVGRLYATKISPDGTRTDYGLVCTKMVTTAGVNYLVDGLQANTTDVALFKFHASGTGVGAEATGNTALGTEVATRTSGSQTEGASANIYRTVGTISYSGTFAITEHGILSASSGGTLLDRSVFAAINVISGDSIQFTYELTLPAGS
jgi:hypothetical protein